MTLHHGLEELGKVSPGFHGVGAVDYIEALVHIHQIGQRVDHDGMDFRHTFCHTKGFVDLQRIGDGVFLELGFEG